MRTLIDGYNLMHAVGLLRRQYGPDGFRKARHRFLNELAARLGPIEAHQTTIVFDASDAPDHVPHRLGHKGLTVVFAVGDENADERLERLIAGHSAPKGLTVVSSDHRVRDAARRRRARVVAADEFWSSLPDPSRRKPETSPPPVAEERARLQGLSAEESAYWQAAFADLVQEPEVREALRGSDFVPTDEEIARIEREVEDEFR